MNGDLDLKGMIYYYGTSINRIQHDIETIASFNKTPGKGYTRFSYSEEDLKAKEHLIKIMKNLGLYVKIDGIGNVRGRLEGSKDNLPAIVMGSHIDTVAHGGKFDGVVGVVGGLEAIRVLKENNVSLEHPLELIIFAEEEGSNFGATTSGSKALIGKLKSEELKNLKDSCGKSYYDVLKRIGLNPDTIEKDIIKPSDVKAMLELHIEQSIVLDKNNLSIGIVTGISGIRAYSIELTGEQNHAGATPMDLRKDPMITAAKIILAVNEIVKDKGLDTTVGTVGKIECTPNATNVIPQKVKLSIDIRDVDNEAMDNTIAEVIKFAEKVATEDGVNCKIEYLGVSNGMLLSQRIMNIIEEIIERRDISYCKLNSGAVHDSALMAQITEVGMIFVPSKDGKSHVPEEFTSYEDIKIGCDVLVEALIEVDKF